MNSKLKLFCLVSLLFGVSIIVDCELLKVWRTAKLEKMYGDSINAGRYGGGERVTKVDIGYKTIVVHRSLASHIYGLDSLDILSTMIFYQVMAFKVPFNDEYKIVPPEYGINRGLYFYPILLIIASTITLVSKSKSVRDHSLGLTVIMVLLILYVLFLN
ncbi:hypothetical protein [Chondrinema litorale]|uniref:hypothetical protein n=1 Tax=Chondrinema litorale TaxID=2994555 RepID=UPI002542DED4|nr:hypothetical protein [Chondrinema litorale]UZR98573.1 hypothetical protein OQ292_32615 [Chondrinema litorale]